jgi:hypothetical protein
MRKKIKGYILQFTRSDHEGRHIHVYKDDAEIGVYDREEGPIRGLEGEMNRGLRDALVHRSERYQYSLYHASSMHKQLFK